MTLDELRSEHGRLQCYAWPGGYNVIYWFNQNGDVFPACGDCAERFAAGEFGYDVTFIDWETGDLYEEDLPCGHCGKQLAAYFNEEG